MATIRTSIQLYNGMTSVCTSMTRALNVVLSSFESMQRVSGQAVDTTAIVTVRNELARAESVINEIESGIRNAAGQEGNLNDRIRGATGQQEQFNNRVRSGESAVGGLAGKVRGLVGAYVGIRTVAQGIKITDNFTQTTARLNLMKDEFRNIDALQNQIYQSAQRSRVSFMDMSDAVSKIGLRAGDIFKNNDETIAFVEQLNKMFVIAGAS